MTLLPPRAVVSLALAAAVGFAGWLATRAARPAAAAAAAAPAPVAAIPGGPRLGSGVSTVRVSRKALGEAIHAPAYVAVDPSAVVAVAARWSGWIRSVPAVTGQRVRRGDVLATFASPDVAAAQRTYVEASKWAGAVLRAGGRAEAAEEARARLERLGVAAEDLDALARRWEPLDELPMRAPVGGWIWARRAVPGAYVEPGATLFEVADLSRVWVVAELSPPEAQRVSAGGSAWFSTAAVPDRLAGRVRSLAPGTSAETRRVAVTVQLDAGGSALVPGTLGTLSFAPRPVDGLAVPVGAVTGSSAAPRVVVKLSGGRLEARPVRLGVRAGGEVQVLEGVAEGEEVVTAAAFLVDSESAIDPALDAFAAPR